MPSELRPGLPPLPRHMLHLPIDKRGYPVPYFVAFVNGEPDHRIVEPQAVTRCLRHGLCWICGKPLGTFRAFTVGPMCAVNRINSEPPAHLDCARYAVQACPFLSRPHAKRRGADLPDDVKEPAGIHITRNPGVTLIWSTRNFRPVRMPDGGMLFELGDAELMEWYAEGRRATLAEVDASLADGLLHLLDIARADGTEAVREVRRRARALVEQVEQQYARSCE